MQLKVCSETAMSSASTPHTIEKPSAMARRLCFNRPPGNRDTKAGRRRMLFSPVRSSPLGRSPVSVRIRGLLRFSGDLRPVRAAAVPAEKFPVRPGLGLRGKQLAPAARADVALDEFARFRRLEVDAT